MKVRKYSLLIVICSLLILPNCIGVEAGFVSYVRSVSINQPVSLATDDAGVLFVAQKSGVIQAYNRFGDTLGTRLSTSLTLECIAVVGNSLFAVSKSGTVKRYTYQVFETSKVVAFVYQETIQTAFIDEVNGFAIKNVINGFQIGGRGTYEYWSGDAGDAHQSIELYMIEYWNKYSGTWVYGSYTWNAGY